ncbi:Parvalbumin [Trema orientale]|uniref:Parvalbumin n=1 Tax=Trema orientale TaxID=63057 RepID=A0A2P5EM73_TREOI|nr:Parvalbumin [Trema orientale]
MDITDHYRHYHAALVDFEDYFPSMIGRLGAEGFIWELCNGFRLLMDAEKGLITFESLKRNSVLLGLHDLRDDDLVCMLMEGDLDGDGALSQMEFCILMFRLSPGLMDNNGSVKQCWTADDLDNHVMNVNHVV